MTKSKVMPAQTGSAPAKATPVFAARDLAFVLALPFLTAFSWLAPQRLQILTARMLSTVILRLLPRAAAKKLRRMSPTFDVADKKTFFKDVVTITYFELLQLLRYHLPGARTPSVRLKGEEFLARASRNGKGAILWVAPTTFGPMLTKVALKQHGCDIWHLSRPTHGYSPSLFGQKFLNPIRINAENKFLAERIVIRDGQTRPAIEKIVDCLRNNRLVSITVGAQAKAARQVPFVNGTMTIALRPIDLARQTGALLLPVVAIRAKNGEVTVRIGPPLPVEDDDQAVQSLVSFLESQARKYPEQFAQASIFWPPELLKQGDAAPAA